MPLVVKTSSIMPMVCSLLSMLMPASTLSMQSPESFADGSPCCSRRDKKKKAEKDGSPDGSANGQGDDEDDDLDDADGDEVVWSTDTSTAAVEKRAAEQLSDAMAGMVTKGNVEAEQEAAARRAEKEAAAAAKVRAVLGSYSHLCKAHGRVLQLPGGVARQHAVHVLVSGHVQCTCYVRLLQWPRSL